MQAPREGLHVARTILDLMAYYRKNARIKAGYTGLHKGYGDKAAWLTRPTGTITAPLEPQIIPPWYCEHLTLRTISVAFRSNGTHATASHAAIILLESSINGLKAGPP